MYKPVLSFSIVSIFIFIASCSPENNYSNKEIIVKNYPTQEDNRLENEIQKLKPDINKKRKIFSQTKLINEIEIILPSYVDKNINKNLINSFELSIYKKAIKNIKLNVNIFNSLADLDFLLKSKAKPGKIFIGTLGDAENELVKKFCSKGILFFSFVSNKDFADECIYLINFFPEDDLIALFDFFPKESKIALLYPENFYGYHINNIIDPIASKSNSLIINRASYKEDLTNAREAIKELSKYSLRKYELSRQKLILQKKNDEISKKALKKIKKFQTIGNVDFTHVILPDYGIRLLEIAPLLPFYDVDPNTVQFVGTGVWDDNVFFNEPSLQGAIFSGIEKSKRKDFFNDYENIYKEKPIRTATIPYDLLGIISYMINDKMTTKNAYDLLNNSNIKFEGIDGKFFFVNNIIFRELDILRINNGIAKKLN